MTIETISSADTFETWRIRTNEIIRFLNSLPFDATEIGTLISTVGTHTTDIADIKLAQGTLSDDVTDFGIIVGNHTNDINTITGSIGVMNDLTTTDKTTLVGAINEVRGSP
jgi:hypothetical protein